jgi:uncharacterized protein YpmS
MPKHFFTLIFFFNIFLKIAPTFATQIAAENIVQEQKKESLATLLQKTKTFDQAISLLKDYINSQCAHQEKKKCDSNQLQHQWVKHLEGMLSFPAEGWKLHISATKDSALRIIQVIIPLLESNKIAYKIASSNRHLDFLDQEVTQSGKLITIYPSSGQHGAIAKLLDQALSEALEAKTLIQTDMKPLTGDAQLGKTGGLYARYGNIVGSNKKTVKICSDKDIFPNINIPQSQQLALLPRNVKTWIQDNQKLVVPCQDIQGNPDPMDQTCIHDNRTHPWPDFMNDRTLWSDTSPFPSLELKWENITWSTRPQSWSIAMSLKK